MSGLTMESLRKPTIARFSAGVTVFFFTFVYYLSPAGRVVAEEIEQAQEPIVLQGTPEQKMNQGLLKLQEIAAEKQAVVAQRVAEESGVLDELLNFFGLSQLTLENVSDMQTLTLLLEEQHANAMENFNRIEADLIAKGASDIILHRHRDTVSQHSASYNEMKQKVMAVLQAESLQSQNEAAKALDELMRNQKLKRSHQKTDPNNLPWGVPDAGKTREPGVTPEELSSLTGIRNHPQPILLAANVITPEMLGQPGGPVAEDLAETPDIQFSDAIRELALLLNENPVEIYNWVRNNIEYIPSYGSIQGADYTLQHGRGNAFDTASLLIALLRASNIPARYAYGTVDIPADKVMNWVGGVDVPEAAQQLLGQGGIPNTGLIDGGRISHIRMEQVWVEAWVDYFPSRAAKHRVGDTWIPLDASFKQYEFTEGEDLENNVPFNAQVLLDDITQAADINEQDGYVQGVDQSALESAINGYQQEIETYINNQNPEATVGDVLGTQKVIVQEYQQLAAGLPYELVARTHNYSELPDRLRHKFRYTLGTEYYGQESSRLITFEKSLPELAGNKLALSFKPASQADEDLIASYLPEPDPETGEIDPDQLPNTLPGYLIRLAAEFRENGEVVYEAEAGTMGGELYETLALWSPNYGWRQAVNHPAIGEYRAIGIDLQGANPEDAQRLQDRVEATRAILESQDQTQLATLTKNEVVGDLLYATIYSYLALNDVQDQIQAKAAGMVTYRLPSYGIFSTSLETSYWFGLPRNVSFSGLGMDVDHLETQTTSKDNDKQKRVGFIKATGARSSAMEHLVPEQMFSTEENPAQGISAVKALALASAQGQKIWTIDQNNLNTALAAINLSGDIETEIRNAVNAGKTATTHESPIAFAGGTNVGYLLIDPETGAGAYKIAGGENGGELQTFFDDFIGTFSIFDALVFLVGIVLRTVSVLSNTVAFFGTINNLINGNCKGDVALSVFIASFMFAVTLMLTLAGGLGFLIAAIAANALMTLAFEDWEGRCAN